MNSLTLDQQRALLLKSRAYRTSDEPPLLAYTKWSRAGHHRDIEVGKQRIREGACGCLLIAGGQGTRLGQSGPKGMCQVTLFQKKSLFQLVCERVIAAGKQAGCRLPLAVMTSPENDHATRHYFNDNRFFGLTSSQVEFFVQGSLPLLDDAGNTLLNPSGTIATGPDGNGSALACFYSSGLWTQWQERGIQSVSFILIDNPLADPYDAELLGFHDRSKVDVTVKATLRQDPHEKVGILVQKQGQLRVVEYTELSDTEKLAQSADGQLKHRCANISLFCFSMAFIKEVAQQDLPFHLAHKSINTPNGSRMAWKFERYIFDVLPFAKRIDVLVYPRDRCFAALKNLVGVDSVTTVQEALNHYDKVVYAQLTGQTLSEQAKIELDPQFYYPTPSLLNHIRLNPLPTEGYIPVPATLKPIPQPCNPPDNGVFY